MQTYEILVRDRTLRGNSVDMSIVRTSVGMDTVHVLFDDDEWLDFPVTITFAKGDVIVTQAVTLSRVNSSEWAAETSCIVPHEVLGTVGAIRVTLQGTDSNGRHIITARGTPLTVEESGDVVIGDVPEDAPTIDQWHQAYAQAVAAANAAQSLVDNLESQIGAMLASAGLQMQTIGPATTESLGVVQIGNGLSVTEQGLVSVDESEVGKGMTDEQSELLNEVVAFAEATFDDPFGEPIAKNGVLPIATRDSVGVVYPDDMTIKVTPDGRLYSPYTLHLPIATTEEIGGVIPDGDTILVDDSGGICVPMFTDEEIDELTPCDETIANGDEVRY